MFSCHGYTRPLLCFNKKKQTVAGLKTRQKTPDTHITINSSYTGSSHSTSVRNKISCVCKTKKNNLERDRCRGPESTTHRHLLPCLCQPGSPSRLHLPHCAQQNFAGRTWHVILSYPGCRNLKNSHLVKMQP